MPITLDEFAKLPAEKPERAAVPNEELIGFLGDKACTSKPLERITDEWLAGFCDGEGSFHFVFHSYTRGMHWRPYITITQINQFALMEQLRKELVAHWTNDQQIQVRGLSQVLKVASFILPHLKVKREVASYIVEFCNSRLRHPYSPYIRRELECIFWTYVLNYRGGRVCKGFLAIVERLGGLKEVATFLGVAGGTAYSRLKRLLEAGLVKVAYEGARAYWTAKPQEE